MRRFNPSEIAGRFVKNQSYATRASSFIKQMTRDPNDNTYYEAFLREPYLSIGEDLVAGNNVFLIAPAGSGKSVFMRFMFDLLKTSMKNVKICSTTGKSAIGLSPSARTFHSTFGIGLCQGDMFDILGRIDGNYRMKKAIENMNMCMIDEVSMLGASVLDKTSFAAEWIRRFKNIVDQYEASLPQNERHYHDDSADVVIHSLDNPEYPQLKDVAAFGGIQIFVTGDPMQLPAINDKFFFESGTWKKGKFRVHRLSKLWRYKNVPFANMLLRIRVCEHTESDVRKIMDRMYAYQNKEYIDETGILPTRVYPINRSVNAHNQRELKKLPGEAVVYTCLDTIELNKEKKKKRHNNASPMFSSKEGYLKSLKDQAPEKVTLKPGAQVSLTYNVDLDMGLANGTKGVVVRCLENEVVCRFNNVANEVVITPVSWVVKDHIWVASRSIIPLKLAWASSIHKCQGETTGKIIVDLESVFEAGQAYVALGRAPSLEHIFVINFDPKKIRVNAKAKKFDEKMRMKDFITVEAYKDEFI